MNWIDYTIFGILFFASLLGLASGPVLQFLRIGCLLISFFIALFFYDTLNNILKGIFTPSTGSLLSYFIIFGTAFIIMYILTDILNRVIGKWKMGIGLRLFGALLGIMKGIVFCGVVIFGVLSFCSKPTYDKVNTSKVAAHIGSGMQSIVSHIPENISKGIKGFAQGIQEKDVPKGTKPFKDEGFKGIPAE